MSDVINESRNDQESRMSEQAYNSVFEHIQGTLVPKTKLEEAQNKILHLESMLEKVTTDLEKEKSESCERKRTTEIIQAEKDSLQAEKESLQAEKESLQAEKKAIEVKFNEVSLKLKQKTDQYDSLLKSKAAMQTETKKIKEESREIGIVNVPASTSSGPNKPALRSGTRRQNATKNNSQDNTVKKKKIENSDNCSQNSKILTVRKIVFRNMSF